MLYNWYNIIDTIIYGFNKLNISIKFKFQSVGNATGYNDHDRCVTSDAILVETGLMFEMLYRFPLYIPYIDTHSVVHQTEIQPPLTKLSIDKYINGEDVCLYKMTKYGQKKSSHNFLRNKAKSFSRID